jgi:hypothetical protein
MKRNHCVQANHLPGKPTAYVESRMAITWQKATNFLNFARAPTEWSFAFVWCVRRRSGMAKRASFDFGCLFSCRQNKQAHTKRMARTIAVMSATPWPASGHSWHTPSSLKWCLGMVHTMHLGPA